MTEKNSDFKAAVPFVLPFVVFMVLATFVKDIQASYEPDGFGGAPPAMTRETWRYIAVLSVQIVVCLGLLFHFRKHYVSMFKLDVSSLGIWAGIIGFFLWVGLCYPQLEHPLLELIGMDMSRPGFNPFQIGDDAIRILFLSLRFTVLCLVVPLVEEIFLRGWFVRWCENPSWKEVQLQDLGTWGLLAASVYGVLSHPVEAIAAFAWFGLVTLVVRKTGNLWDAVVAHAITNSMLGIYVLMYGQWQLW